LSDRGGDDCDDGGDDDDDDDDGGDDDDDDDDDGMVISGFGSGERPPTDDEDVHPGLLASDCVSFKVSME